MINSSELQKKLTRFQELKDLLSSPEVAADPHKIKTLGQEYNELAPLVQTIERYQEVERALQEAQGTIESEETDHELLELATEEVTSLSAQKASLEQDLEEALAPVDSFDQRDTIVEIRAGVGGDEAGLFAGELFRMYARFAERQGWQTKLISSNVSDLGGIKEVIFEMTGQKVYSHMKFESGVHRVQRVPETEKSGRVHTSTVTVAVVPKAEEVDLVIEPKDVKIETSTSRGAGGQSVQTTYSAIRVTHLPTGLVVTCQDERSQQQNRLRAMQVLRSRLLAKKQEEERQANRDLRRAQIGTGDRSEKIRTYNFPQDRVTDHRLKQNWHDMPNVMDGNFLPIIQALQKAARENALGQGEV